MRRRFASSISLILLLLLLPSTGQAKKNASKGSYLMYVGTYTGPESKGIYAYRFDAATGKATPVGLVAETVNPSFLAIDPDRRFLYAANEVSDYQGQKTGAVSAFAIDRKSGKLKFLNQVSSQGAGPCYVSLDKTGKYVLVANYDSGTVAAFPVLKDGKLGEASATVQHAGHGANPEHQEGPHAHQIDVSRDNRFALVTDLGLDQVLVYRFDAAKGMLAPNDPPFAKVDPGAGPRHFVFHPNNKFVYVIDELASTVTAFSYDAATGSLQRLTVVSTLPPDYKGKNDTAEIKIDAEGKFLYGSNRGADIIAIFALDSASGAPKLMDSVPTGGKTPRNFEIDPSGGYLLAANQATNNIVIFKIDPQTGHLTPTGQTLSVAAPVCIKFVLIK